MRFASSVYRPQPHVSLTPGRKKRYMILAMVAISLVLVRSSWATPVNIVSLSYVHPVAAVDCEDTIAGEDPAAACAPVGVTLAGSLSNPFLNDVNTKTIDLGYGSYYTFGNPYAPTDFMVQGTTLLATILLSDGTILSGTILVPDLSVAGTTMYNFASNGITISTTGITRADRMSFGFPPAAFAGDGIDDYTLQLDYVAPVPEPGSAMLLLTGLATVPAMLRKRISSR